jgi:hypothetical protein
MTDRVEQSYPGQPAAAPGAVHPGQQPQYPQGQAYPQQGAQPAFQDGGQPGYGGNDTMSQAADFARRHIHTAETKPFYKTSEFMSSMASSGGVLIAAAIADNFHADEAWPIVGAISIGYMISRGLAKAGTRRGDRD